MDFSILNNIPALQADTELSSVVSAAAVNLQQLASGSIGDAGSLESADLDTGGLSTRSWIA